MEMHFDNQQLINSITPNIDVINALTIQRNWAIGASVFIGTAFIVYIVIEENKKQTKKIVS
jgi:hypothetical protein